MMSKSKRIYVSLTIMIGTIGAVSIPANTYTIITGVTDSCHEVMAGDEIETFLRETDYPSEAMVPTPQKDLWEQYAAVLLEGIEFDFRGPSEKFMGISLILGARWPDEQGRSVSNTETLYLAHSNPLDQYEHCLRMGEDDYEEGEVRSLERAREFMRERWRKAREFIQLDLDEQIIEIDEYVEFYGQVKLEVWAPAFYLGTMMHAVQDGFSHTIRSDDLKKVRHVMNFIEAVTDAHNPSRDGLAHSMAMDRCHDEAVDVAAGAIDATTDLLVFFSDNSDAQLEEFLEEWFQYEAGCTEENDYCDSKWTNLAHMDPIKPLSEEIFSCSTVGAIGTGRSPAVLELLRL